MKLQKLSVAYLPVFLCGCALFSKGEVTFPRYFTPEPDEEATQFETAAPINSGRQLRLGRVTAASYLGDRITFRKSEHELGFYDDRLWTEKPETYLRRALIRVLFEEKGLKRIVSGRAPTLDAELVNFEEVKGDKRRGVVRIAFSLREDNEEVSQKTVEVEEPVRSTEPSRAAPALAEALGRALDNGVRQLSELVIGELALVPALYPPCSSPSARAVGTSP